MYVENEGGMKVSTSSLNEELGNVEFILSDKTGTLTKNNMKCCGFSMGGYVYEASVFEHVDSSEAELKKEGTEQVKASSKENSTKQTKTSSKEKENNTEEVRTSLNEKESNTEQVKALLMQCNEGRECSKLESEYITNVLRALFLCNSVALSLLPHR